MWMTTHCLQISTFAKIAIAKPSQSSKKRALRIPTFLRYESLAAQYLLLGDYRNGFAVLKRGLELFPADAKLRTLDKQARSATLDGAAQ